MYRELAKLGHVEVVAPLEEKSTTGHSLTIHKPLRIIKTPSGFYGVNGSPADCVYMGIREIMKTMPDLVVSGINRGANLGQDVYYSGTVSAAREACILGIRSLAVSLSVDFNRPPLEDKIHYATAAKIAVKLLKDLKKVDVPKFTFMNLNVPDLSLDKVKGIQIARQGFRFYSGTVLKRKDHRGRDYFWVGGKYKGYHKEHGTDCDVVARGYASLTPMKLDSTNFDFLTSLEEVGL